MPKNADAYNWLAYAVRKNGDPAASIPIYEKALALDPKHRGAHEYIGEAYLALQRSAQGQAASPASRQALLPAVRGVQRPEARGRGLRKEGEPVGRPTSRPHASE